jgi:hypothetical protein
MNYEALNRKQCDISNNFHDYGIINNNDGTINNGLDTMEKTANFQSNNSGNTESMDYDVDYKYSEKRDNDIIDQYKDSNKLNNNIKIYRYKFSNEFIEELYKFSKIHQYDNRKDFKEAWELWVDENSTIIFQESTRLIDLRYDGDILNKMFMSARYYFRKKGTEKKEPRLRCTYIGIQKELLDAMDNHIKTNFDKSWYKPSTGFTEFCKEHIQLLKQEIELLIKYSIVSSDEIKNKVKKTYKNRYFMIINKNN